MDTRRDNKIYDLRKVREKIRAYCLYRERSHREVRQKLLDYGLLPAVAEVLLSELIQERFCDEERFARAFVRGKFSLKKWGRRKIRAALYPHQLSEYILRKAFSEIDEDAYQKTLRELAEKKWSSLPQKSERLKEQKLVAYLVQKGYESDMVWETIKALKG